jgi:hypothetical protein
VPGAFPAQRPDPGAPRLGGDGSGGDPHDLRPALPSPAHVRDQPGTIAPMLGRQFPKFETMLREAADDVTAFADFPVGHWTKIWSTNPLERLNKDSGNPGDGSVQGRTPAMATIVGRMPDREHGGNWVRGGGNPRPGTGERDESCRGHHADELRRVPGRGGARGNWRGSDAPLLVIIPAIGVCSMSLVAVLRPSTGLGATPARSAPNSTAARGQSAMLGRLRTFRVFWYDFIVGNDWLQDRAAWPVPKNSTPPGGQDPLLIAILLPVSLGLVTRRSIPKNAREAEAGHMPCSHAPSRHR